MRRFVAVGRGTAYLPKSFVDEWLPEDHMARFLDASRGSAAHQPAALLSLQLYGYTDKVFSARKIERAVPGLY